MREQQMKDKNQVPGTYSTSRVWPLLMVCVCVCVIVCTYSEKFKEEKDF